MRQAAKSPDTFPQQVYMVLTQAFAEVQRAVALEGYQLYQQRRYPGEETGREMAFDVAIERRGPGQEVLAWLWVWSCIDCAEPVSADDIHAFCAAFNQVNAEQVKGGIATTGVLTPDALQAAGSQGVCVVRLMPAERVKPLLYRPVYQVGIHNAEQAEQRRRRQAERALTDAAFTSIAQELFAMSSRHYFSDLKSLFTYELAPTPG
ncbi:hypothetical protein C2W62_02645 [Candidatus Entotheonella serta]|nr:hypothetical protein C2W62_02645 [Candidatus Entotheonella serta]